MAIEINGTDELRAKLEQVLTDSQVRQRAIAAQIDLLMKEMASDALLNSWRYHVFPVDTRLRFPSINPKTGLMPSMLADGTFAVDR